MKVVRCGTPQEKRASLGQSSDLESFPLEPTRTSRPNKREDIEGCLSGHGLVPRVASPHHVSSNEENTGICIYGSTALVRNFV